MQLSNYYLNFFLKKILSLGTMQFVNLILTVFLISFLLKLLGPSLWGKFILLQIITNYLGWICQWSFSFNELREVSQNRSIKNNIDDIFCESTTIQLYFSFLSIIFIFLLYYLNLLEVGYLGLIGLFFILVGHGTQYSWFLSGMELFWQNAFFPIIQKILIYFIITFVFFYNINLDLLLLIYGFSSIFVNLLCIVYLYFLLDIKPKFRNRLSTLERLKMGFPYFISSIMSNSKNSVIPISLGIFHGDISVGLFNAIDRIKSLVVQLSQPVTQALYPRISYLLKSNPIKAFEMKRFFLFTTLILISPFILFITLFPETILIIFAGKEFINVSSELRLLVIVSILTILSEFNLYQIILAGGMKKLFFILNLLILIIALVSSMFFIREFSIYGAVITILIFEIFTLFLIFYGSKYYAK